MHIDCYVCGLGPNYTLKQNFLSLILLILLAELTNQKKGIYKHHILYPLQLGPPFPNNVRILKPKIGLGPKNMKIDLRKVFMKNITYFWNK